MISSIPILSELCLSACCINTCAFASLSLISYRRKQVWWFHIRKAYNSSTSRYPRGTRLCWPTQVYRMYVAVTETTFIMPLHKCHRLFSVFLNTHQHETKAAWGDERWGSGELCSAGSTSKKYSKGKLPLSVIKCSCETFLF